MRESELAMKLTQDCVNARTLERWKLHPVGSKENVLALSDSQIESLPTLPEVVSFIKKMEQTFHEQGGWNGWDARIAKLSGFPEHGMLLRPRRGFCNNAYDNAFVMNRIASGRFNLQPNLRNKPMLYRGQNTVFFDIKSGFDLLSKEDRLIANLRYDEFYLFLKTHPLCMLFDNGIYLEGLDEPIFFENNYYGFAQHYGFKTGLTDFSSDIMVSAFFAATTMKGDDVYEIFNDANTPYGIIYTWDINPESCFTLNGFSTVGKQYVPRCGAQRGFFQNVGSYNINFRPQCVALLFKHVFDEDKKIYDYWDGGAKLFPEDEFAATAQEILHADTVGLQAFAYNKYVNPRDLIIENINVCKSKGVDIDPHKRYVFSYEMLEQFYSNIDQYWSRFCADIYIGEHDNHKRALESLQNLPDNPYYSQFFKREYYGRLAYAQIWEEMKNSIRIKPN